jgi:hypothetical protein
MTKLDSDTVHRVIAGISDRRAAVAAEYDRVAHRPRPEGEKLRAFGGNVEEARLFHHVAILDLVLHELGDYALELMGAEALAVDAA